jgi:hypothetical protein
MMSVGTPPAAPFVGRRVRRHLLIAGLCAGAFACGVPAHAARADEEFASHGIEIAVSDGLVGVE